MYDVVLRQGRVIDPQHQWDKVSDLAIHNGCIAAIEQHLPPEAGRQEFDLTGLMVTPGLIDAHSHCYHSSGLAKAWAGDYSLQPDYHSFRSGVTTMVDTGSAGSLNFVHFYASVIERSATRILAYLNIADYGMSSLLVEQFPERNDPASFVRTCKNFSASIVGIKIAHYEGKDWHDLDYAQTVQQDLGLPIMVDFGVFKRERPYQELVSQRLRAGDISTHCFRAPVPVLDPNGQVYSYLWRAKERGILFDLGHGAGSFVFRNAVPALKQGFWPDSLSTDLHGTSLQVVVDLATILSKIRACSGATWPELFSRATCRPASYLGHSELGHLGLGAEADLAVWSVRQGVFGFQDSAGGRLMGREKLECELTFRAGKLVWDLNGRSAREYQQLPALYGLDLTHEDLITPVGG